ncbi:MAG TPA: twin-arginine translocation signal domain-containing protein, partial [Vicinamibacteria bacterium]|nr:twin-arginine translocation signal domain-containing protein [Vicinamibacteria bacterium]
MTTPPRTASRREFLGRTAATAAAGWLGLGRAFAADEPSLADRLAGLRARFSDLPRHFVFEYYPWYGASPWRHWDQWGRRPPDDLAANYV